MIITYFSASASTFFSKVGDAEEHLDGTESKMLK